MRGWVSLAVATLLLSGCATTPPTVQSEYDRFTKSTTVTLGGGGYNLNEIRPHLLVVASPSSGHVTFGLVEISTVQDGWRYLYCHPLFMLADGKPVDLPEPDYDNRINDGTLTESISVGVSTGTIEILARATTVEIKVCHTEFRLNSDEMDALRKLAQDL